MDYERIIMGIDPGTNVMGYGVLGINGKKIDVIVMGVIELNRFESHYKRLHRTHRRGLFGVPRRSDVRPSGQSPARCKGPSR